MIAPTLQVFSSLSALADPLRCRLLLLLERRELSVAELVRAMQMPQSNISRHLKALADEGLITSHEEGASNRYTATPERFPQPVRRLWSVLREQTAELPAAGEDARRLNAVLSERRTRSQAYFSTAAGQWDRIRKELFGETSHYVALLSLLDPELVVGDLGAGTGHLTQALAPFVKRVIAVDDSSAMLAAARKRLAGYDNVEFRKGDIASLPIENEVLDLAVLFLVLPFVESPVEALREAARTLRPEGRVLVVDMLTHDRDDIAREMGHLWRGFSEEQLSAWSDRQGFTGFRFHPIAPDPAAKGPSLFSAVMKKKRQEN